MRVIVFAKSTPETEAAQATQLNERSAEDWAPMMGFHEELAAAGVLLASDRLEPTAKGARLRFDGCNTWHLRPAGAHDVRPCRQLPWEISRDPRRRSCGRAA